MGSAPIERSWSGRGARRIGTLLAALAVAPASAQLRPDQVLVIYDSRLTIGGEASGLLIAEAYAGSVAVPGGVGGVEGTRRGVRTLDLASMGAAAPPLNRFTRSQYNARLRDPIREHLLAEGIASDVRVLLLTRGVPHQIDDSDNPLVGNQANQELIDEATLFEYDAAAVDSELTLLWEDLDAGFVASRLRNGAVENPYWRSTQTITSFDASAITAGSTFNLFSAPRAIFADPFQTGDALFQPGDLYLVGRLDGPSTAVVTERLGQSVDAVWDLDAVAAVLDESTPNTGPEPDFTPFADFGGVGSDREFDTDGYPVLLAGASFFTPAFSLGDDYEPALWVLEPLLGPERTVYDDRPDRDNFVVGPNLVYLGPDFEPEGRVVTEPLILLASEGSNHTVNNGGQFPGDGGPGGVEAASESFPLSFNYAQVAVFNTIESYSGQLLGTITGDRNQGQVADFLGAGGTHGFGQVWEPFSSLVADNEPLARSFFAGPLTWIESAYTALPIVSWMTVVVGDPLSRPIRSTADLTGVGRRRRRRADQRDGRAHDRAGRPPGPLTATGPTRRSRPGCPDPAVPIRLSRHGCPNPAARTRRCRPIRSACPRPGGALP